MCTSAEKAYHSSSNTGWAEAAAAGRIAGHSSSPGLTGVKPGELTTSSCLARMHVVLIAVCDN